MNVERFDLKTDWRECHESILGFLCKLCKDPTYNRGRISWSSSVEVISQIRYSRGKGIFRSQYIFQNFVYPVASSPIERMIMHMTDDVKELTDCHSRMYKAPLFFVSGKEAEEAGLWAIALKTAVVNLIFSCNHQCLTCC
jgi:hypothetical protein